MASIKLSISAEADVHFRIGPVSEARKLPRYGNDQTSLIDLKRGHRINSFIPHQVNILSLKPEFLQQKLLSAIVHQKAVLLPNCMAFASENLTTWALGNLIPTPTFVAKL